MGAAQDFEIYTDHANLQYFKKPQKLNRRQARWLTELQEFHFTLHHIPGKSNSKADLLSRRPGFEKGVNDNEDTILLPEYLFSNNSLSIQEISIEPITFLPRILRNHNQESYLKVDGPDWKTQEDNTLTFKDRVYVPLDKTLRADIIAHHHDTPLAGHYGRHKTAERILRNYWWPTIHRDIKTYVTGCETCQRVKPRRLPAKTPLHPFEPPSRPWELVTTDLIGPLPESQGCNAILTIVDWLSKQVIFEPTNVELTSEGFAKILRDRVIREHGLFRRLIHDRDTRFVSKYIRELFRLLGIEQNPSTAYHPQTDGQTERMNQTIEQYLRAFINFRQDDWKEWLPLGEFAYNDSEHAATKQTPFFINTGQHPWTGIDTRRESRNKSASEFAQKMKQVREDAQAALRLASQKAKEQYDKHARTSHYEPRDKVYLEATNIRTKRPSKKLDDKRFGPFEVVKRIGESAYELKLPDSWAAVHPVYNETYLTPYRPPKFNRQKRPPPPPPIMVDEEEEHEVEEILDHRKHRGRTHYLVHWKGYPHEENTWEPPSHLQHAWKKVDEYHRKKSLPLVLPLTIRTIEINDPRLFDPLDGVAGINFTHTLIPIPVDVIIPLTPLHVDYLLENVHEFPLLSPTLPPQTRRVWIYENEPVDAVTFVLRIDTEHVPLRIYQLLNPLRKNEIRNKYDCLEPSQPRYAPPWLKRDYSRHLSMITNTPKKMVKTVM
jgi:transposase InsO family protein